MSKDRIKLTGKSSKDTNAPAPQDNQRQSISIIDSVVGNIEQILKINIPPWAVAAIIAVLVAASGLIVGAVYLSSQYTVDSLGNTINPSPFSAGFSERETVLVPGNTQSPVVSTVCVNAGDQIETIASGAVVVGQFVGATTADGSSNPLGGFGNYDVVEQYLHGALLCRITTETNWRLCGAQAQFTANSGGCLELFINDNDRANNTGEFSVRVGTNP